MVFLKAKDDCCCGGGCASDLQCEEETDCGVSMNTGSYQGSRYERDGKLFVADENGVITVSATDMLPAAGWYYVFAAPYDADSDGIYEYDSSVKTTPTGGFHLDIQYEQDSLLHWEYDAETATYVMTQTEFAPSVQLQDASDDICLTYLSIENTDLIPIAQAETFDIDLMFNRPIRDYLLADTLGTFFQLTDKNGMVIPVTVTNTGYYMFTVTPDSTLTPAGNPYSFTINQSYLVGYPGEGGADGSAVECCDGPWTQAFKIYDPDATMLAHVVPSLDLNPFNSYDDVDFTYKVDWDAILRGAPSTSRPFAEIPMIPNLYLSMPAAADAYGYQVWFKSNGLPWQMVDDDCVNVTYNDGLFIEATVDMEDNGLFDAYSGEVNDVEDGGLQPWFAGNVTQVVVMKVNVNGFAQDPNTDATIAGLTLADNWGPELVLSSGTPWVDTYHGWALDTQFTAGTFYDETGIEIHVDEPLADVTLTAEYASGEFGCRASSGYFTVADIEWPDLDLTLADGEGTAYPSSRAFVVVDLAPTVSTTLGADADEDDSNIKLATLSGFAIGDAINLTDNTVDENRLMVTGFDYTNSRVYLNAGLGDDADSGDTVYWVGSMQNGSSNVSGDVTVIDYNTLYVADDDDFDPTTSYLTVPVTTRYNIFTNNTLTLTNRPTAAVAAGSSVTGYELEEDWDTPLTVGANDSDDAAYVGNDGAAAEWNASSIAVCGALDAEIDSEDAPIDEGDILIFDFDGEFIIAEVEDVEFGDEAGDTDCDDCPDLGCPNGREADLIELDDAIDDLEIDDAMVIRRRGTQISTTAAAGYPTVVLTPTAGLQANAPITFTDDDDHTNSSNVVGVYNGRVVINDIFLDPDEDAADDVRLTYAGGEFSTTGTARVPDAIQCYLQDRSGNTSTATDKTGNGAADADQIGFEKVDGAWGLF